MTTELKFDDRTKELSVSAKTEDGLLTVEIRAHEGNRLIHRVAMPVISTADFNMPKALTVAWLSLGLFTPLADRIESLSDHGLSRASFYVSGDGIMIARAYRELTGNDITEAI